MTTILIMHGPNLNLLGTREPDVYGSTTLPDIEKGLITLGEELGVKLKFFQSNSEGALIDRLHAAREDCNGVVFNPGAYTHTSVALRDAITSIQPLPVVEIHLSNVYARSEEFRHKSLLAPVCIGQVAGFGSDSYLLGLRAIVNRLQKR